MITIQLLFAMLDTLIIRRFIKEKDRTDKSLRWKREEEQTETKMLIDGKE